MGLRTAGSLIIAVDEPIFMTVGRSAQYSPVASKTDLRNSTTCGTPSTTIRGVTVCHPSGVKRENSLASLMESLWTQHLIQHCLNGSQWTKFQAQSMEFRAPS